MEDVIPSRKESHPIKEVVMTLKSPQGESNLVTNKNISFDGEGTTKSPTRSPKRNFEDTKSGRSILSRKSGRIGRQAQQLINDLNERIQHI